MRTSQQTYLAKLGFADSDRNNALHDNACLYLSQPEKAEKLLRKVFAKEIEDASKPRSYSGELGSLERKEWLAESFSKGAGANCWWGEIAVTRAAATSSQVRKIDCALSRAVMGGYNDQNIIGYLDVSISASITVTAMKTTSLELHDNGYGGKKKKVVVPDEGLIKPRVEIVNFTAVPSPRVSVEVKAFPTAVTSIIQQLETYRQNGVVNQVLCTLYPLPTEDAKILAHHGYWSIYVSPADVEAFMAARSAKVDEERF